MEKLKFFTKNINLVRKRSLNTSDFSTLFKERKNNLLKINKI